MEKAFKMGKASATGSFQLFVGVALSSVIMAVGSLVLARLITPAEYGLYSVSLIPALMISLFRDWGINSAITKYIAHSRTTGDNENAQDIIVVGLIFEIVIGLALTLLSVCLAGFIASTIFHRPNIAPLISMVSITIFTGSLLTAAQSSFVGLERIEFQSLTLVCQAIIKSVVGPLLVFIGLGALGAVIGYILSFVVASIVGSAVLYISILSRMKGTKLSRTKFFKILNDMLRYGVPLSISTIIGGFLLQFYGFMMAFYCNDVMIGNYQVANNFAVLLTFFTIPIATVLFPAFAKLNPQNEPELVKTVFKSSVKYTAILLVPATTAVMVLAQPMVSTLFGEQYVYAPFFLSLLVITNLTAAFGNLSMNALLTGLGETKALMKLSLLTLALGFLLAFLLIPNLGITGIIIGNLIASIPSTLLGLGWIFKKYRVSADLRSTAKVFASTAIVTGITYISLSFFNTAEWMRLMVGGIVFLVSYLIVAPFMGAIVKEDIHNLRALFSGMGFIVKIINLPFIIAEKAASIKNN